MAPIDYEEDIDDEEEEDEEEEEEAPRSRKRSTKKWKVRPNGKIRKRLPSSSKTNVRFVVSLLLGSHQAQACDERVFPFLSGQPSED